jgi:mxaA protein
LAGHALFAHQTDQFIDKHNEFSGYQDQIDSFYQLSTEALYSEQKVASEKDFDQLLKLCKQLAGAEKLALKKS